ncbi:MAG TPA: carboxypeptidase-like regulatory domain-containing protein [Pyrinomonadaceae bacterium]
MTGRNGSFAIEGLPPGDYEVVIWHEKFKEARAKASVGVRETKVSNFTLRFPADAR